MRGAWDITTRVLSNKSVFYGQKDGVASQFVYAGVVGSFVELRLTGGNFKACPKRAVQSVAADAAIDLSPVDAFVSYDERQSAAARLAGLRTIAPGA